MLALKGIDAVQGIRALLKQCKLREPAQFESLRQLLQQVIDELDGLTIPKVAVPVGTEALERDELLVKLAALASLLECDLGAVESPLADLRIGVVGGEAELAVAEITAKVDVFAIDEALAQLNTLRVHLKRWHDLN